MSRGLGDVYKRQAFKSPDDTLVVYTPAVPESHTELTYFRAHGFEVMKRARVLGEITKSSRGLCVAGTHGKTTTSSMLAHLLKQSPVDCNAFLGGILKNYESNLMLSDTSDFTVIEADEFDRSFHWLTLFSVLVQIFTAEYKIEMLLVPCYLRKSNKIFVCQLCLLYTSDAADE